MSLVSKYINNIFHQVLNVSNETQAFHGKWVCITLDEWLSYAKEKSLFEATCLLTTNFKKHFFDFLIEKINVCGYGAGNFYEIYEQRRQEEIEIFLSNINLSDNEITDFKKNVDYVEDNGSFLSKCEFCDIDIPNGNIHLSLQLEGKILCNSCLSSCC